MVIHSVTPAQLLVEQQDTAAPEIRQIDGGYAEGYNTPQGFRMSRLCSTDPQMYLRKGYSPGSLLPPGR